MKIIKQPLSYIAIGSLLCAIIVAVVGTMLHPTNRIIYTLEKSINEQDYEMLTEVFIEDEYSAYIGMFSELTSYFENDSRVSLRFIPADEVVSEEGEKMVSVVVVVNMGEAIYNITELELNLLEVDGTEYISIY